MIALAEKVEAIRSLFDQAEECRVKARARRGYHLTYAGTSTAAYQQGRKICSSEMRRAIEARNAAVDNRLEDRIRTLPRSRLGDVIAKHALGRMPQCDWYPSWVRWGTRGGIRTGRWAFMPLVEVKTTSRPRRSVPRGRNGGTEGRGGLGLR